MPNSSSNYTAEEYVAALLAANGRAGEKDMFYRPFRLGMQAAAEAGDKLSAARQQELMADSLAQFANPPEWLNADHFRLTVLCWGERITSPLCATLRDKRVDSGVRRGVAEVLGTMPAREAIPELRGILRDKSVAAWVRQSVAEALGTMQAREAIPELRGILRDKSVAAWVRGGVAEGLGTMPEAREAIPELLAFLRDERVDSWVRRSVVESLQKLANRAKIPIPSQ